MDGLRRRFSPLVAVAFDEEGILSGIYRDKVSGQAALSFIECLQARENLEYAVARTLPGGLDSFTEGSSLPAANGTAGKAEMPSPSNSLMLMSASASSVSTDTVASSGAKGVAKIRLRFREISTFAEDFSRERYFSRVASEYGQINASCPKNWDESLQSIGRAIMGSGDDGCRSATTIDHPIACIHAVSTARANPLEWLKWSRDTISSRIVAMGKGCVSSDILHYHILVRPVESIDSAIDKEYSDIFAEMCRQFHNHAGQLILHYGSEGPSLDSTSWESIMRSFAMHSLIPFMMNVIESSASRSANPASRYANAHATKSPGGGGLAERLLFAGKRLLAGANNIAESVASTVALVDGGRVTGEASPQIIVDSPEYNARRTADLLFAIGSWTRASAAIDQVLNAPPSRGSCPDACFYYGLRALICAITNNISATYKEIENVLRTSTQSESGIIDAMSTIIRLFLIFPPLSDSVKLAIFSKMASSHSPPWTFQAALSMHLMRLYRVQKALRKANLHAYISVILWERIDLVHLCRVNLIEWSTIFDGQSVMPHNASFEFKWRNFAFNPDAGANVALDLLCNYTTLLDAPWQQNLIAVLASTTTNTEPWPASFIRIDTELSFFTHCSDRETSLFNSFGKVSPQALPGRVKDLCESASASLGTIIDHALLLRKNSFVPIVDGEDVTMTLTLTNSLYVAVGISEICLKLVSLEESNARYHFCHLKGGPYAEITVLPQGTLRASLTFEASFVGAYAAVALVGLLNKSAPISMPIISDKGAISALKISKGPPSKGLPMGPSLRYTRFCLARRTGSANLCISVSDLGPNVYHHQDVQATITVVNNGKAAAHDVHLFSVGIDSFPSEGIYLGSIGENGGRIQVPLAYQPSDPNIILYAACKHTPQDGGLWATSLSLRKVVQFDVRLLNRAAGDAILARAICIGESSLHRVESKMLIGSDIEIYPLLSERIDVIPTGEAAMLLFNRRQNEQGTGHGGRPVGTDSRPQVRLCIECIYEEEPITLSYDVSWLAEYFAKDIDQPTIVRDVGLLAPRASLYALNVDIKDSKVPLVLTEDESNPWRPRQIGPLNSPSQKAYFSLQEDSMLATKDIDRLFIYYRPHR